MLKSRRHEILSGKTPIILTREKETRGSLSALTRNSVLLFCREKRLRIRFPIDVFLFLVRKEARGTCRLRGEKTGSDGVSAVCPRRSRVGAKEDGFAMHYGLRTGSSVKNFNLFRAGFVSWSTVLSRDDDTRAAKLARRTSRRCARRARSARKCPPKIERERKRERKNRLEKKIAPL